MNDLIYCRFCSWNLKIEEVITSESIFLFVEATIRLQEDWIYTAHLFKWNNLLIFSERIGQRRRKESSINRIKSVKCNLMVQWLAPFHILDNSFKYLCQIHYSLSNTGMWLWKLYSGWVLISSFIFARAYPITVKIVGY